MLTQRQKAFHQGAFMWHIWLVVPITGSSHEKPPPICFHSIRKCFVLIQHFVLWPIKSSYFESNLIKTLGFCKIAKKFSLSRQSYGLSKVVFSDISIAVEKPNNSGLFMKFWEVSSTLIEVIWLVGRFFRDFADVGELLKSFNINNTASSSPHIYTHTPLFICLNKHNSNLGVPAQPQQLQLKTAITTV